MRSEDDIRKEILDRVVELYKFRESSRQFIPGKTRVNYAGRVFDENEMCAVVNCALDFWLTLGPKGREFCIDFKKYMNMKYCLVTNSGSSANLIAVSALCSKNIGSPIKPGDEVITTALTFPTTLNPILQNNLIPVFVDVEPDTYNINAEKIEEVISPKTRAIMIAHTLGNPADMNTIMGLARKWDLFVIEDTCDALGSEYTGKPCGTFGDLSTCSFYAAHHITMGEGGAVLTNNLELYRTALSIRDWGRACFCETGSENPNGACGSRFSFKFEDLPEGYDHKYVYSNIGYNLKPLDIQCAMGIEQLKKLSEFKISRRYNFDVLYKVFKEYEDRFILPRSLPGSNPSWFAIPICVRKDAGFTKNEFVEYLELNNIETRMLFAGNILKHPGYKGIVHRALDKLENTDEVLKRGFFLGVYPGITDEKLDYMMETIHKFMKQHI